MPQTPREIVTRALRFATPERLPRDLWLLPWAYLHHPDAVAKLLRRFPPDLSGAPAVYHPSPRVKGDPHTMGRYVDEWGCEFTNIQAGLIGEVHNPLIESLVDRVRVVAPYEILPNQPVEARSIVDRYCGDTDLFVKAACCPRPWERYQFLRGSLNALMDMADPDAKVGELLDEIHRFYLAELQFWARTDVDALMFMDDWGAQDRLLIAPAIWRDLFKPLYRDYCDLAHAHGKFAFMHSDGDISAIYPDLIEIGVDALNSQLFCMDLSHIATIAKGHITFWGEIDRQHVLPSPDPRAGGDAVRLVAEYLYDPQGGLIAQFEFGAGAQPATALAVCEAWEAVQEEHRDPGQSPPQ